MYCKICGDERNVSYVASARQSLCPSCAADTPAKVSRETFDARYWPGEEGKTVPDAIKREFYSDYLASTHGLDEYVERTTSAY